ncbi:Nicotine blue oxidoreductase [Planctomycetes bacterium Pla163]|uniref:Nicotine blue oxidoreductase n=1 Tax=Rohdeia mirabilis TaxID=2528008 RepID=A0A518D0U1_9BACT|nr:Nicotine blue oxidoreductase [Planctomycetes bacterium Pla163]
MSADPPLVVVLAAGASRRLGQPKALCRIGGTTALEGLVERALAPSTGLRDLVVVTGRHHAEIAEVVARANASRSEPLHVRVLENADWARGRTGSFARAVRARPDRDLLLAPIDVPRVASATFAALQRAWRDAGRAPRGWLACAHVGASRGRRFGHPIVIGRELARDALALDPDAPLRELRDQAAPLAGVDVDDPTILEDLDTPDDLARLRELEAER